MKIIRAAAAVTAALIASLALTSALASAGVRDGALREFEGRVVSVNAAAKTFQLRDHHRGVKTIRVRTSTRFEDLAGFSSLRAGLRRVEAKVRRVDGAWVARKVELSGRDDDRDDDDRDGDDHGGDRDDDNSGPGGGDD
jgi:Domain of unknown function (DUF5666)